MRIVTWNVPSTTEHHIRQGQLRKSMSTLSNFDSFFSIDLRLRDDVLNHYGTATITRRTCCVPIKVEEGIGDRFVRGYTDEGARIGGYPTETQAGFDTGTMDDLDREGRATIIDTGLFVLINVYSPNPTPGRPERYEFKLKFEKMLDCRVRNLVKAGREVIVCGDLNIAATSLDVSNWRKKQDGCLDDYPPRVWLNEFTSERGSMVDIWRKLHPTERALTNAQGVEQARVDYFLITPGLLPWVKDCKINRFLFGSDHYAVLLELHDSIKTPNGEILSLWEAMNPCRSPNDPPPAAPLLKKGFAAFLTPGGDMTESASLLTPQPSPSSSSSSPEASTSRASKSSTPSTSNEPSAATRAPSKEVKKVPASMKSGGKADRAAKVEKESAQQQTQKGGQQLLAFPKASPRSTGKDGEFLEAKKRAKRDDAVKVKKRRRTRSPSSASSAVSSFNANASPPSPSRSPSNSTSAASPKSAVEVLVLSDDEGNVIVLSDTDDEAVGGAGAEGPGGDGRMAEKAQSR
ncbi:hypothetical protein JCM6882_000534 [Rhodosporidiobolus microsporus]